MFNKLKKWLAKNISKALPGVKIPTGSSISFDSNIKVNKTTVLTTTVPVNDICFFKVKNENAVYEHVSTIAATTGRKYYTLTCLNTGTTFVIEERAFNIIFSKIDNIEYTHSNKEN